MKKQGKTLLVCLAVPLAVGAFAALLTAKQMKTFDNLDQPPLSPPGWLFPVVWTILYLLMGWASFRVVRSGGQPGEIHRALTGYGVQLVLNFLWPLLFFGLGWYGIALAELAVLWVAVLWTMGAFFRLDPPVGNLLLPYLLWVSFAAYLNFGIWRLNG